MGDAVAMVNRFLSTPSARRATGFLAVQVVHLDDFYPRPPRGGRLVRPGLRRPGNNFYPRPPRGGRRPFQGSRRAHRSISIHALREEGDLPGALYPGGVHRISIHALREEGDPTRWAEDTPWT